MSRLLDRFDKKAWSLLGLGLIAFTTLFLIFSLKNVYAAGPNEDGRLITIHDKSSEKVIVTKAGTVAGALKQAHISVRPDDNVDPGLDTKLTANAYQVNVYRAQPVLVIDGTTRKTVMSPYETPRQIADAANLPLYTEDNTTLTRSGDVLDSDGAGLQLSIKRATVFTLVLYGKSIEARTQEKTVGDMLRDKKIKLGKDDTVSLAMNTPIKSGIKVEVWRNGKQTVTEEQEVDFPTQQIKDADREVGYKEVKTPGVKGKKMVSFEIEMRNGQEVSRQVIQEVVTTPPQQQVEIIGTKQKSFGGSCGEWIAGAGIADTGSASYLIGKESGCNPYSVNRSTGACGLGQEYPCGKSGCELGDGACQARWMNSYVLGRYGSWDNAAAFHRSNGWY